MKVCLLNVLHEAGDKRVFQKIARSLAGAGYDLVSIAPGTPPDAVEGMGTRFVSVPAAASMLTRLRAVGRLWRLGKAERADVYFAPEPESWVAALGIKTWRWGRVKVVFDMHEHVPTEFAKFFPAFSRSFVEWLTVRFMRLFARYTDSILLTRESFEPPWKGLAVPRTVIINTNHLQPRCAEIPEAVRAVYEGGPALLHQGIFGDVRGSYQLLEAMALLHETRPEIRCFVLGRYVYGSVEAYREAIAARGLEKHLVLLDEVPFNEVPAHIAASDIGLILFQPGPINHTLAMPHKLFDYMREAKPVIVPDFALEVRHIVNEADCGVLVDVTRPDAIARAALELLGAPEEMRRLGENGRRAVETKYNWQAEERRLLAAFKALE